MNGYFVMKMYYHWMNFKNISEKNREKYSLFFRNVHLCILLSEMLKKKLKLTPFVGGKISTKKPIAKAH